MILTEIEDGLLLIIGWFEQSPQMRRKVRTPEGKALGNSQEDTAKAVSYGKCNRKYTACKVGKGEKARQELTG